MAPVTQVSSARNMPPLFLTLCYCILNPEQGCYPTMQPLLSFSFSVCSDLCVNVRQGDRQLREA